MVDNKLSVVLCSNLFWYGNWWAKCLYIKLHFGGNLGFSFKIYLDCFNWNLVSQWIWNWVWCTPSNWQWIIETPFWMALKIQVQLPLSISVNLLACISIWWNYHWRLFQFSRNWSKRKINWLKLTIYSPVFG